MRPIGLFLIATTFIVPAFWFTGLAGRHDNLALFSQYLGVCALIAMGSSQLLATRIAGLETIFGGLDRIYVLHKWLGIAALALVLLHDTIDAEMNNLGRETALTDVAETLGEVSLYGLLILATISIVTFVPYHLWKYTHKLIGGFFAASAFHFMFIQKPFANTEPLGLYVLAFCLIGVVSYMYALLPVGVFKGWRRYKVSTVKATGNAIAVTLTPTRLGRKHRAGQFAFVSFDLPGYGEIHPFTISKAPDDTRSIRFTIKNLGEYTGALQKVVKPGLSARVSRPFGHFRCPPGTREQVWIASGIGITPFVAWSQALTEHDGDVHLFYSVRRREDAAHVEELEAIAARKANLHLQVIETQTTGRLTADQVASAVRCDRGKVTIAYCGPKTMRETFRVGLAKLGFSPRRFLYEEFEIRSGIGLRRLFTWIMTWATRSQIWEEHTGHP